MPKMSMKVIRGGRVVDIRAHAAPKADILVKGDTIVSGPGSDVRTGNAMPLKEVPGAGVGGGDTVKSIV